MALTDNKSRSKLNVKISGLVRYILWNYFARPLDLYRVSEFPKSGGSWLSQMITAYTGIYFPQYEIPSFRQALLQGHHLPSKNAYKTVAIIRDGRDVMVSYYYHMLIGNDKIATFGVNGWRKKIPFEDYQNIRQNMPRYIEYMFTQYPTYPGKFSWTQFARAIAESDACKVRYEDLLLDCRKEMTKVIEYLTSTNADLVKIDHIVNNYSFAARTKRNPGEESTNSFLRKGISGDWKNHFTPEAIEVFYHYAKAELELMCYDTNPVKLI